MKKIYYAIMAVMAMMFAGCSSDEKFTENANETNLTFDFTVEGTPSFGDDTRVIKNGWEKGDCVFVIFNDATITNALKYIKLTYNSTDSWTATLEGVGDAKLTEKEALDFAGKESSQVYACYMQGVTELKKTKFTADAKDYMGPTSTAEFDADKGFCSFGGYTHYFPKDASQNPFVSYSDLAELTTYTNKGGTHIKATLNLNKIPVTQIAVTGLTSEDEWYIVNGSSTSSNRSCWILSMNNLQTNNGSGFVKGALSADATEAAKGQFDFFIQHQNCTTLQLINYTTGIKYTRDIKVSPIPMGKAYRVKGPKTFTAHTDKDANGWTAETIEIYNKE